MCADIYNKSVSCFILPRKSPIFKTDKEEAVNERSCLSYIHSRQGENRYRYGVGVDCLFICMAFGDASLEIDKNIIPRFFCILKCLIGNELDKNKKMKKFLLFFVAALALCSVSAYAELTPKPVTGVLPGNVGIAMTVDNQGLADLTPAIVYENDRDVEVTIFGENFTEVKKLSLKNIIPDEKDNYGRYTHGLNGIWAESADLANIYVTKNFFVKNDKWCVTLCYIDNFDNYDEIFYVVDEDGNNLGTLNKNGESIHFYFDSFYKGHPFLMVGTGDTEKRIEYTQFFTFTGTSGIEAVNIGSMSKAYPNPLPAGHTFTVEFDRAADNGTFFTVVDMQGRQVYRSRVKAGETSFRLSGRRFGHGRYVYTVVYDDGESTSGNLLAQ